VLTYNARTAIHTKVAKMSVQFRTRSQTQVDYSQFIAQSDEALVGCCYEYDSETNTVNNSSKTLSACNQVNGYFLKGSCDNNVNITPSSIGCCCWCGAPDGGSPTEDSTFCDCQDKSGLWTLGTCSSLENSGKTQDDLCISPSPEKIDHRRKRACCYPKFKQDGTVEADCIDVCTEKECAEKTVYPYTATYYKKGRRCNEQVGAASPAIYDCKLSSDNTVILNSCKNGTNLFCWNLPGYSRCRLADWYPNRFPGRFLETVDQTALQIRRSDSINYDVILGPTIEYGTGFAYGSEARQESVGVTKLCTGGHSYNYDIAEPDRWFDGYIGIIDTGSTPRYFASPIFASNFPAGDPNSPIPAPNLTEKVLDLITTKTFSASINLNNDIRIYGRFYNANTNQSKPAPIVTDSLKKLYSHNVDVGVSNSGNNTSYSLSTIGFIGQKLDNSFDYYSPFINDSQQLKQLRDMVRSIPPKNYIKASFGAYTFCGIDESNSLTCVSLNQNLSFPINNKYKLVSCSNGLESSTQYDIANEFCFAVDTDNRFHVSPSTAKTPESPALSITDVISLSCTISHCLAVVEPDENVCNSQILGSCCYCENNVKTCKQTNLGNCHSVYNGAFVSGGICCDENRTESCVNCLEIENLCDGNSSAFFAKSAIITQDELPSSELTFHQDGLYVGVFEPGPPVTQLGSTVRGNPYTGSASEYKPTVIGYGTTAKKWAIIVAPNDYKIGAINDLYEKPENIPASMYDGLWNTYGDGLSYYGIQSKSMEDLRSYSRLSGWYLPSKNELEFINLKVNQGFFIPELFKSFETTGYLTSTPYFQINSDGVYNLDSQIVNKRSFMYAQNFSKSNYGSIYLVPRTQIINVRLIRRIELE